MAEELTSRRTFVLVCEDDDLLGQRVAAGLRTAGFSVDLSRNLADACRRCGDHRYDCLIVDRGLPDGDGLELVRRQRESGVQTPALIITARDSPAARSEGYAGGADDWLAKPFSLQELAARVRALLGHRPRPSPIITVGDLVVDRLRRRVRRDGILLTLTPREFEVLEALATRATVDRSDVADYCDHPDEVEDMIARLQRKLGAPRLVEAVDSGFRLRA